MQPIHGNDAGAPARRPLPRWPISAWSAAILLVPSPARAHGFTVTRADPPLPFEVFVVGAVSVLTITYAGVSRTWHSPRWQTPAPIRTWKTLPGQHILLPATGVAGLVLVVAGIASGAAGPTLSTLVVWVVFWLALPFAETVVGDAWTLLNPFRTLTRRLGLGERERPEILGRFGVWPATAALGAFGWFELVYPESGSARDLGIAALVYTVYTAALAVWAGRDTGLQLGDVFTVYHRLFSSLAPLGRSGSRLVYRGWLRSLARLPRWRGLAGFAVVMVAIVTFDGLSQSFWWRDTLAARGIDPAGPTALTIGLLAVVGLIGSGYWLACAAAAGVAADGRSPGSVAASFAHSLVPIAVGYAVAHYLTVVLIEGQLVVAALSDPFALGWDLLGTATWVPVAWLPDVAVSLVQVAAVLGGHVVAVLLAHDRAVAEFPPGRAAASQHAMLTIMVALTILGLGLLTAA